VQDTGESETSRQAVSRHHATLSEEQIEAIFHQANIEYEDDDANPDDLMNRVELLEFLMRLAQAQRAEVMLNAQKSKDQVRDETWRVHDQLGVLISDYVLPLTQKWVDPIIHFRDRKLVNMREVSVLVEANFRGIALLYK
jgi:hypothetical protein